jgi:protein-tyrosine kinase
MEHIRQAVERATGNTALGAQQVNPIGNNRQSPTAPPPLPAYVGLSDPDGSLREVELRANYLESQRVIAHDNADPRSRSYDMLRTQILQSMDLKEWQVIAVTSPTPGCGKTLTAINLALSVARQRERSALLIDMDLQKPQIANRLGVRCEQGILGVLEGKATLENAMFQAQLRNLKLSVLPCEARTPNSSEWMASGAMAALLRDLRQADRSRVIIIDLPPMLIGDDVISILPHVDCVLFVAAVGSSTITEIKECNKHLQSTTVIKIALNKVADVDTAYYYY